MDFKYRWFIAGNHTGCRALDDTVKDRKLLLDDQDETNPLIFLLEPFKVVDVFWVGFSNIIDEGDVGE